MKVRIKLFASLAGYLPAGAVKNEADIEVDEGTTPAALIAQLRLPLEHCHLVLVNGAYVAPGDRDKVALVQSDALAIWPPVAGG